MKKILVLMLVLSLSLSLVGCSTGTEEMTTEQMITQVLLFVGLGVAMYFLMIRPQRKREKKAKEMIGSMEVGDGVTTIGGIVGRIVSIKDDTVLIETGSDRTKIRFQKGAIQEVEKLSLEE